MRYLPVYSAPLLFLAVYLWDGMRRLGGYLKHSVSTLTKGHGTRTPATGITVGSSSCFPPGVAWEVASGLTLRLRASSCIGLGSFIVVTETRGGNGERREHAG